MSNRSATASPDRVTGDQPMPETLGRGQLIFLTEQIKQGAGTEDQVGEWLDVIDHSVPAPAGYVSDLIFWPDTADPLTSVEIVDRALGYRPICLSLHNSNWDKP